MNEQQIIQIVDELKLKLNMSENINIIFIVQKQIFVKKVNSSVELYLNIDLLNKIKRYTQSIINHPEAFNFIKNKSEEDEVKNVILILWIKFIILHELSHMKNEHYKTDHILSNKNKELDADRYSHIIINDCIEYINKSNFIEEDKQKVVIDLIYSIIQIAPIMALEKDISDDDIYTTDERMFLILNSIIEELITNKKYINYSLLYKLKILVVLVFRIIKYNASLSKIKTVKLIVKYLIAYGLLHTVGKLRIRFYVYMIILIILLYFKFIS